jgi:probable HAF family extracellular repeat protein
MIGQRLRGAAIALGVALALGADASSQTGTITTVAGGGPGTMAADQASLRGNVKVVPDASGNLYVSVGLDHRVYRFDVTTGTLSPFAGTGFAGFSGDGGPAIQAQLSNPYGLALDETGGLLYISDTNNRRIRVVDLATGNISTVVGDAPCGTIGDGGPALAAGICSVVADLAVGANGTLYFADDGLKRIRAVEFGVIETIAGNGTARGAVDGQGGNPSDDYLDEVGATSASLGSVTGLAVDGQSLYFYEQAALAEGGARIRRVDLATGILTSYAGNGYLYDQYDGPGNDPRDDVVDGAPALDSALAYTTSLATDPIFADLYVAIHTLGLVRRIPSNGDGTAGTIETVAGGGSQPPLSIPPTLALLTNPTGIGIDGSGTLYVAANAYLDATGYGVYAITPFLVAPLVGNGHGAFCGDGGPAVAACLNAPTAARPDGNGSLLVADDGNVAVRSVAADGTIHSVVGKAGLLAGVADLWPLAAGQFLFSVPDGHTVYRAEPPYGGFFQFAGHGVATGSIDGEGGDLADDLGDGELAWAASLHTPAGLARDDEGNTFIADTGNHRVRRVDGTSGVITTVAGTGTAGNNGDGLLGTATDLFAPYGLAFATNGDLLVTERDGHRVRRIAAGADHQITGAADEIVSALAGTGQAGSSGDGGDATLASLNGPTAMVVDPFGHVYVADGGNRVRRIDAGTGGIDTIAGGGAEGDGVPAVQSRLDQIRGLSTDVANGRIYLYVTDAHQNRVRRIDLGPEIPLNQPPIVQPLGLDGATLPATASEGAWVGLYADAIDPDGDFLSYRWSGPFGTATGLGATVRLPVGVSTVSVEVDDGNGHSVTASATVTVSGVNTSTGNGEIVTPTDDRLTGGTRGRVTVAFLGPVTVPGLTWLRTRTDQIPPPPAGKQLGSAPFYYEVATTAVATGDVRICLDLTGMSFALPAQVELHRLTAAWNGLGLAPDLTTHVVCVQAPFAQAFATYGNFTPADPSTRVTTVAGTGQAGDTGDGGPADQARLRAPEGLALDRARHLLYIGEGSHRVRRVNLTDGRIDTIAGTGSLTDPVDGVDARLSSVGSIAGLAVDADGNLFIGDRSHCLIRRVDASTNVITTVAGEWRGPGLTCGHEGDGDVATSARIGPPYRLVFDAGGNLFFTEQPWLAGGGGGYVRRIAAGLDGRITGNDPAEAIATVAGDGTQDIFVPDGVHPLAAGIFPFGLAVGSDNALYVAENNGVLRLEPGADGIVDGSADEVFRRVYGSPIGFTAPFQGDGGPARDAYAGFSNGLSVLSSGDVLVASSSLRRIRRIAAGADGVVDGSSDELVTTWAGFSDDSDPPAFNGDGYALTTVFAWPTEMAVDATGTVFVADSAFHRVRRIGAGGGGLPTFVDLEMTLAAATPNPVDRDAILQYEAGVRNNGPATAHAVRVSMAVPATLDFVSASPAGACTGPPVGTAGSIVCDLGDLAAGASNNVLIDTRPSADGPLTTSLSVAANEPDPDASDNTRSVTVDVVVPAVAIDVVETITVTDEPTLMPSVMLEVGETITVTDTPAITPSVMLDVTETITVTDTPGLASPLLTVTPASGFPGATITLTAALTSFGSPVPGKAIAFSLLGTAVGSATTGPDGLAIVSGVSLAGVTVGTYTGAVQASFAGDTDLGAASGVADLIVSAFATTVTLTSSLNPSVVGDSVTFTASVSSSLGVPPGDVEFSYRVPGSPATFQLGTVALDLSGTAALSTTQLNAGTLQVTARYVGSPTFGASQAVLAQTVARAPSTITLATTGVNAFTTRPPIFTATVASAASWPATGTVEFFADGVSLGRAPVFERGGLRIARMGGATLGVGTYEITAEYSGDPSHQPGQAGPLSQTLVLGDYFLVDLTPAFSDPSEATAVNANDQVVGFVSGAGFLYSGGGLAPLGGLGGNTTVPLAINDAGQVVGSSRTAAGFEHAFLYQGGAMTDLGTLGGDTSRALAIGSGGHIVGTAATGGGIHGFLHHAGTLGDLGTLGGTDSTASSVNAFGHVAGAATLADGTRRASYFTNSWFDLGTLGGTASQATAINDAGQVSGMANLTGDGEAHAFLWQAGTMVDLAGETGPSSIGVAINDAGQVVGFTFDPIQMPLPSWPPSPPPPEDAFLFANGQFTVLAALSGGTSTTADINNAGLLVGESGERAFVSAGGQLRDLGTLGGAKSRARAINDRGLIVGAAETASGVAHAAAWVAVPVPTLTAVPASGPTGGTATLSAMLTLFGLPIPNQTIAFTLNGATVGTAITDGTTGTATLPGVSLGGLAIGTYPGVVTAAYAGDTVLLGAAQATGDLTVIASRPPVALDDTYSMSTGPLSIAAPGVLANDSDPDGDALTALIVSGPARGMLALAADGSFTYTPGPDAPLSDTFTYRAIGGGVPSNVATVSLRAELQPLLAGLVSAPRVDVSTLAGEKLDPHVDGDLASYSHAGPGVIRYYDFATGLDRAIPLAAPGDYDSLSDVSDGRISFSRQSATGSRVGRVFDVASAQMWSFAPPGHVFSSGFGGETVAFASDAAGGGDVTIWNLSTGNMELDTASPLLEVNPSVSPDGLTAVWQSCVGNFSQCVIQVARRVAGAWSDIPLTSTPGDRNPDTDSTWVVYAAIGRPERPSGSSIYLRRLDGGPELRLALPGDQNWPRISQGAISFLSASPGAINRDLFVYVIETNTLYQITDTPLLNESLADITVLSNGDIRVVWAANDGPLGENNIYALTFTPGLVPEFAGVIGVPSITVNAGAGDQNDPHVDGDDLSYTHNHSTTSQVRHYSFATGSDAAIAGAAGTLDLLSDVSGARISFSRVEADRTAAMLFDLSTAQLTEINPQAGTNRLGTALGGNTFAYVDLLVGTQDIVAWDLAGSTAVNVSNSLEFERSPRVSPDGNVLVWTRDNGNAGSTDIFMSRKAAGVWEAPTPLAATPDLEDYPDTDGTWVVYDSTRAGKRSVFLRAVAGGSERPLILSGSQAALANIHRGVVSFASAPTAAGVKPDLFVYVIATNRLYQVTDTPTIGEYLNDVTVLANGDIRVVWAADESPTNPSDHDIHAVTFSATGGVPAPTAVASGRATICEGDTTPLSGSGGVSCSWSPSTGLDDPTSCTPMASPAAATTYRLAVIDSSGRTSTNDATVTVTVNPRPIAAASGSASILIGQSASLRGSGGTTCQWSPAAGLDDPSSCTPNASPTVTTTYSLVVAGATGCPSTNPATVTVTIRRTLTVTRAGNGTGTVSSSPGSIVCGTACSNTFDDATVVTLTPTPAASSVFGGWTGAADCSDGVVTMDADKTCTAAFHRRPDYVVSALTAPATAPAGATIVVDDTTANTRAQGGPAFPGTSVTRVYLSLDRALDAGDTFLGERSVPALGPSQSSSGSTTVALPAGVVGTRFVLAIADGGGAVPEANETNNDRSLRIRIGADLRVPALTVSPNRARPGDLVQVTVRTRNAATAAAAGPSVTRIYLSADAMVDAADPVLGRQNVGPLIAGAVDQATLALTIPPGTATGTWYLIARADAEGLLTEVDETDNERARTLVVLP